MDLLKVTEMNTTKNLAELEIDGQKYCVMKDEMKHAFYEVERWNFGDGGSNFTQMLIKLVAKADEFNKRKLLKSYPEVVGAYLIWFYKELGDIKFNDDKELFDVMQGKLAL